MENERWTRVSYQLGIKCCVGRGCDTPAMFMKVVEEDHHIIGIVQALCVEHKTELYGKEK